MEVDGDGSPLSQHQQDDSTCSAPQQPADSNSIAAKLAALVNGIIQQTQTAMENILPLISEIDVSSGDIHEDVQQARDCALDRKLKLEEEREKFQQAACRVLDMLNSNNTLLAITNGGGSSIAKDNADGKNRDLSQKFWSTKDLGQKQFQFKIGQGNVIKGLDEGVLGMQLGETARVHCSPDYAYGASGFPTWGIMPNSELVYEIEVLNIS